MVVVAVVNQHWQQDTYRTDLFCTSEICQFDIAILVTHDVTSFDISMDNPTLVQILYPLENLFCVVPHDLLRKWTIPLKVGRQRALQLL